MKHILILFSFIAFVSCKKDNFEVKQMGHKDSKKVVTNIKVVNEEDPVCHMKTAQFLQDTVNYNGKIYGFCSDYCKNEFKKDPNKFLEK